MQFNKAVLVSCIAVMVSHMYVDGAPQTGDRDTSTTERLDGDYLLQLGVSFDNPLIRLLGRAMIRKEKEIEALGKNLKEKMEEDNSEIINKICDTQPCGDWSEWSDCPVSRKGQFSMVTRSRECGQNTSLCTYGADAEFTSRESKVCEGNITCPPEYSNTTGMCLKLYKEGKPYEAAQSKCLADGGHLVNVNTQAKYDAVNTVINAHGSSGNSVWINGLMKQSGTDWEYSYGMAPDFENWNSGQPNYSNFPSCKDVHQGKWYDDSCTSNYYFICEF